jgi:hypothetical protein
MLSVVDELWLLLGGVIVTIILGLAAGMSPTLYITQLSTGSKAKKTSRVLAVMSGVLVALIVLTVFFQLFHLNTLLGFISPTVNALFMSVLFNVFIGGCLIGGGIWYLRHREDDTKPLHNYEATTPASFAGVGFLRTFLSITGVTATFIASNLIAEVSAGASTRALLSIVFLLAAITPFIAVLALHKSNSDLLITYSNKLKIALKRLNYRPVLGVGAILFGSSIVIYNALIAIFY